MCPLEGKGWAPLQGIRTVATWLGLGWMVWLVVGVSVSHLNSIARPCDVAAATAPGGWRRMSVVRRSRSISYPPPPVRCRRSPRRSPFEWLRVASQNQGPMAQARCGWLVLLLLVVLVRYP
jgi:hypothetical protein